jgi:Rieske 2Fe-2S family protein
MEDTRPIRELIACQRSGWSLERRFYTDPEVYKLEVDQIVMGNWIFAGHQSQIAEPGDFMIFEVADESAIIVRGQDNEIRAFANVCRHRGSLVCLEKTGNTRKFECPYHAWVYDTEGKLIGARDMAPDFNKEEHGLHPVSIDVVHGLIFVCFCDDPPSLEFAKRDLAEPMAMFGFENLRVAATKSYPIAANWKLAVENYQECYHCAPSHAEYAKMHTLMLDDKKLARVQNHMLQEMTSCGLTDFRYDLSDLEAPSGQQGYSYSRTAMFEGYKTGSRDGEALAPLLGDISDYDGGASDIGIGPISFFLAYSDHVVGYVFTPIDQTHCKCEIYWMVRDDAVEGKDYTTEELVWLWDVTTHADEEIIVNNWKGVNSRYYQPGPLARMESHQKRWLEWLLHELRRAPSIIR